MNPSMNKFVLLSLLIQLTLASTPLVFPKAVELAKIYGMSKMTKSHYARRNQGTQWRKINIKFDLTKLNQQAPSRRVFYAKIFKIVKEWYRDALWVRDDQSKIPAFVKRSINRGEIDPFSDTNFKGYDLIVDVKMIPTDGGTLAQAGPMLRHPDSQRAITGIMEITRFGDKNFKSANDGVNIAIGTIIHEFAHVIAFIQWEVYQKRYFKYNSRAKLWYFNGPKVVSAMAKYYGCTTTKAARGMPVETFGPRDPGAHWDEAFVQDELMSPVGGDEPEKLSQMSMALFEDSGWYKSNYRMVENYTTKKGTGCKAVKPSARCPTPQACVPNSEGFITRDFKGIGYCDKDNKNCPIEFKYGNRNANSASGWEASYKKFGAAYGNNSTIANGEFYYSTRTQVQTETQVSVITKCNANHKSYTLTFQGFKKSGNSYRGNVTVTCSRKGKKNFNENGEYTSHVECNDPDSFCQAAFGSNGGGASGGCHSSCNKNGRCHPGNVTEARELKDLLMTYESKENQMRRMGTMKMPTPEKRPNPKKQPQKGSKRILQWDDWGFDDWGNDDSGNDDEPADDTPATDNGDSESSSDDSSDDTGNSGNETGSWKCWCYSDGEESEKCPNLSEDNN